jgi:hypothetical protein
VPFGALLLTSFSPPALGYKASGSAATA